MAVINRTLDRARVARPLTPRQAGFAATMTLLRAVPSCLLIGTGVPAAHRGEA